MTRYVVRVYVSGGVTGSRNALMKENGTVQTFKTEAQAQEAGSTWLRNISRGSVGAIYDYAVEEEQS